MDIQLFTSYRDICIILHMMKLPNARDNGHDAVQYCNHLWRNGYTSIGFGAFGEVFARKDEQEVTKVGAVNADGYMQFVRHVGLRSSNPHLPYIRKVEIFDPGPKDPYSQPYYAVTMELLQANYPDYDGWDDSPVHDCFEEMGITDLWDLANPHRISARSRAMVYIKGMLTELYRSYVPDIKWGNVLFRDRTLVITDPVACYIGD